MTIGRYSFRYLSKNLAMSVKASLVSGALGSANHTRVLIGANSHAQLRIGEPLRKARQADRGYGFNLVGCSGMTSKGSAGPPHAAMLIARP
jgi:hypothetical protein